MLVPPGVQGELAAWAEGSALGEADTFIEVVPAPDADTVRVLQLELDRGEAEAIALALALPADLLLLDERKGRQVAARLGVRHVGLLGVLVEARRKNLVPELRPILEALRQKAGFWFSEALRQEVLRAAGE